MDWATLYRETHVGVRLHLARLGVAASDVEDVSHDVYLIAQRRQSSFDSEREVRPWLFGICLRVAANHRRKSSTSRRLLQPCEGLQLRAPDWAQPERQYQSRRALQSVLTALEHLSPSQRAVFVLFEIDGCSGREIAQQLRIPLATVHSRLHAARHGLSQVLLHAVGVLEPHNAATHQQQHAQLLAQQL